jgi:uridine kinase
VVAVTGGTSRRAGVLASVAALVPPTGRWRVGVDGVDGAGKSVFASGLAAVLRERGREVVHASADDVLNPRGVRYRRGRDDPEGFYRDSVDTAALLRELLEPFGPAGTGSHRRRVHDLATDRPVDTSRTSAGPHAVLVLDGIFLQAPALTGALDLVVFLRASFAATYARMAVRDGCPPDPDHPANRRYRQGQQLYLDEIAPADRADVLVDVEDVHRPRVLRLPPADRSRRGHRAG